MSGKNIIFDNKKTNKSNFYKSKKISDIDDIHVNKISTSKNEAYSNKSSFKYFIGYNDDDAISPLYIKLPKMIRYNKSFDNKLLRKYIEIWEGKSQQFNEN